MTHSVISGKDNATFRRLLALTTKRGRDAAGQFLLEGEKFVAEALAAGCVRSVVLSEDFAAEKPDVYRKNAAQCVVLASHLFARLADTKSPPGILACCDKPAWESQCAMTGGLFLLLEEIKDPGNMGAIIRTADAAGVDAVFASPECAEVYSPKVLRGSAGSVFRVPVFVADLCDTVEQLRGRGVAVYAAHLAGAAYPYGLDLREKAAFIIGSEARGISSTLAARADAFIKLPMPGGAESLNAAVAAGVLLYEAVRQRCAL